MSTTSTIVDMATKPAVVTYSALAQTKEVKNTDGTVSKEYSIKATTRESEIEIAKKDGNFLFAQSFSFDLAGSVAGISQLGIPDEEVVAIFNNGLKAKVGREIVKAMQELTEDNSAAFQPVEGNYDARSFAAEITGRRGLSDIEKAINVIKKMPIPQAQIDAFVQTLLAQLSAQKSPEATV